MSTERHTDERERELPPVGGSQGDKLGQGHTSEIRPADQTITSTAPRDIAERPQATQASLQPHNQAIAAKQKELAQQTERTTESPEQQAIRANIEGTKKIILEVYASQPEKLEKMLKAIDDKIPDIMSGKVTLPPIEIKTTPERRAVRTPKLSKDNDIER